jgi:hypothetical protein
MQRFISEDPIGFAGGDWNLYAYVENNPVNYFDWDGLTKGGDKNINVIHKGVEYTGKSPAKEVEKAIKEAVSEGMSKTHIRSLEGVWKVSKRLVKFGLIPGIILDELLDPSEVFAGEEELLKEYLEKKEKERCTSGRKC